MPIQPIDIFQTAERVVGGNTNVVPPAASGDGSRQNRIPPNRVAVQTRNLVRWFLPECGYVDMYINPQNIVWSDKKAITPTRTKGGYVVQYWGEELTSISISGTTGSSGVEGINVLYDIYRSEQVAFDPVALALAARLDQQNSADAYPGQIIGGQASLLDLIGQGVANTFLEQITNALQNGNSNVTRPKPTLASLAAGVEMYWSGWTFRGFFTDFKLTESAAALGLFEYSMTFMCTQRKGYRSNFLGWHRSAVSGASNSDPDLGVPYSYNGLAVAPGSAGGTPTQQSVISLNERLQTANGYVGDPGFSSIF